VVQSNLTKRCIAAAHGRFNRIQQVAAMCTPIYCMLTQAHRSPMSKVALQSVQLFLHSTAGAYTLQWAVPFRLKIVLAHWGIRTPI